MQTLSYRLTFLTPAFLGNADQAAQWRTPPIKALLRQWWRVVYAAEQRGRLDVGAMRSAEGRLFGVAADAGGESRKSAVRLRVEQWSGGKLKTWDGLEQTPVRHDEVEKTGRRVGPHLYLGYGPLTIVAGKTGLTKTRTAIDCKDSAIVSLAVPEGAEGARLERALSLMHLYGTLGGRSRNGWGSFVLAPMPGTPALAQTLDADCVMPWRDALACEWAQAMGSDARGPLIWQTSPAPDWMQLMRQLAVVKIGLRTQFEFPQERPDGQVHDRHWLSYPVTRHTVHAWGNLRLPNTLRFKVRAAPAGKGVCGVIFHMPCLPPQEFRPDRSAIERVWRQVHAHLDADSSLTRISA